MAEWKAFQADVLDTIRQYQGFYDFFEQVGSVSDSRPDLVARVTRKDKKEIWIVDAKAKDELDEGDLQRMEKYVSKIKSNPVDVGLDYTEIAEHDIRKIFVGRGPNQLENGKWIDFKTFHQFLQKELVYTDTDRVVRDIAKMMKNRKLDQQQARMLHESVSPYREVLDSTMNVLESMESRYSDLRLETDIESFEEVDVPVDAVLTHQTRNMVFLIDIPYSREAVNDIRDKIESLKEELIDQQSDVYYIAVNHFEATDEELIHAPDEIENEIKHRAGIVDAKEIADIFRPKIPVDESFRSGRAFLSGQSGVDFSINVKTINDTRVEVEARLPEKAVKELKNRMINSRMDMGEFKGSRFKLEFELEPGMKIYGQGESFKDFREAVQGAFQPSVNPVLARIYNTKA